MKNKLLIFFITLFNCYSFSQTKIDSLKQEYNKLWTRKGYIADTNSFNLLLEIGNRYQSSGPDSAIVYHLKAKEVAEKINDELNVAESLQSLGYDNFQKSNYEEATKYFSQCLMITSKYLKHERKVQALKIKAVVFQNLASINIEQGRYPKAIELLFSALKINEQIARKPGIARNFNSIGIVYKYQKDYPKSLSFFSKAVDIYKELGNDQIAAGVQSNIGSIYNNMGYPKKALTYYFDALTLFEKNNSSLFFVSRLTGNIANTYLLLENYFSALDYSLRSADLAVKIGDKSALNYAYSIISAAYTKQKKYKLAEDYAKKGLELALELESLEDIKQAHDDFYNIYMETNRPALALESYKQFIIYRDSISNVENNKAIIQKGLQYNYDKKATADSIVNAKAQEIKDAQLAKNKLEIKAKQNQQYVLFGGLALVLVFAGFMYNRFKITQRQKVIIEEQKKLVDVSQKKTMDSINYAKKIQHSILPSQEELGSVFPKHFIFFKPKDIVSGDFYWFYHQNNLSFIAVADCTGHGVPGAFMTMIGYSNLIEVVAQQKVIEPNKILENLHQHIFNNLQQNKGDAYSQDGMDISLVVIDHENSLLHFSGAYNHGYLIQNKQIHTLKATSKSIGGLSILGEVEPQRNFKAETIPFAKGSLLILTTDGIFDQLNKQDEKFGNERFKELALNFNTESAQENLNLVEQTYNDWKQDAQQLDDLCLLGLVI